MHCSWPAGTSGCQQASCHVRIVHPVVELDAADRIEAMPQHHCEVRWRLDKEMDHVKPVTGAELDQGRLGLRHSPIQLQRTVNYIGARELQTRRPRQVPRDRNCDVRVSARRERDTHHALLHSVVAAGQTIGKERGRLLHVLVSSKVRAVVFDVEDETFGGAERVA